ncbi:MAG: anti-sigma regulatory factor [Clostridiales bacterium]|nr:anti-sigma regulatory factor [Clostridiales bacterium]
MNSLELRYTVDSEDFTLAGDAASRIKKKLKRMELSPDIIRRTSISLYEGEINMFIHASGGEIIVTVSSDEIVMKLIDRGPGIEDVKLAMREGYSTAPDNVRSLGFGAGMGLPNMKKYTDELEIESEVGVGTTVTMKIYIEQ